MGLVAKLSSMTIWKSAAGKWRQRLLEVVAQIKVGDGVKFMSSTSSYNYSS